MKINTPAFVQHLIKTFQQSNYEIYIVGGAVRDLLSQKQVRDWDFTTNATPEQILILFPDGFYDNSYGTVGIVDPVDKNSTNQMSNHSSKTSNRVKLPVYEITTFRKEYGYSNQRHPDKIKWGKTLEDDLQRRDFTINAMALKPIPRHAKHDLGYKKLNNKPIDQFDLIDLYQGQKDLKHKLIRAVGDPSIRFQEDALRMMRAVRFASQLGFSIEIQTLTHIQNNAHLIKKIANERIRDELLKLLTGEYASDGVRILASTGLMKYIIPELLNGQGIEQGGHHTDDIWEHSIKSLLHCPSNKPIVRLATLIHDIGKPYTRAHVCNKCSFRFKESASINRDELEHPQHNEQLQVSPLQCPQCGHHNDYYQTVTFYNHEMAGANIAKRLADRLRLSNKQKHKLVKLVRWHMFSVDERQSDKAIRRFIRNVTKPYLSDMLDLRTADRLGGGAKETSWRYERFKKKIIDVQKQPFTVHDLKITGHDIMKELNLKPGPHIGKILKQLYDLVIDKKLNNQTTELTKKLKQLAQPNNH